MNSTSSKSASSSGSKSKRSFNSNTSSSNKTKTSANQKTLGVSWGANSLSSFQRSPFSDFGSYMVETNSKLQNQFETEASTSLSSERSVFCGVSIFVDGFTVPSSQELRAYMLNYGGRYENYFSRRRVTHIICSNLPDSKIKNLRSFSGGLPVVKPDWIVDSVAANKLLSWVPYQLEQVACNPPMLSAFFAPKIIQDSDDALRDSSDQVILESEDNSLVGTRLEDCNESVCISTEHGRESCRESDDMICENGNGHFGEKAYASEKYSDVKLEEVPSSDAEDSNSKQNELKSSTCLHLTSVISNCLPRSENIGSH